MEREPVKIQQLKFTLFYQQHFYEQRQAEIGKKKQAKAEQHPEAEFLLIENYWLSSPTYPENCSKSK